MIDKLKTIKTSLLDVFWKIYTPIKPCPLKLQYELIQEFPKVCVMKG